MSQKVQESPLSSAVILAGELIWAKPLMDRAWLPMSSDFAKSLVDALLPPGPVSLEVLQDVPIDPERHMLTAGGRGRAIGRVAPKRQARW